MAKNMVRVLLLLLLLAANLSSPAQTQEKHITSREQLWLGAFSQVRFSQRWGVWLDVHYRMTDNFVDRPFQFLFRPALTYFIKDNLWINFGYTLAKHYPGKGLNTTRTEHRPWQQIRWNQKYPGFRTQQGIRLEQRFSEKIVSDEKQNGYNYNFRVRYSFSFLIPLKGAEMVPKTPFAGITDEVFLNFGDEVVYNTFDQNRFFAGLGYHFTEHLTAQLGYMHIYQQETSGNNYFSTHSLRLYFLHSLDLRKRDQ